MPSNIEILNKIINNICGLRFFSIRRNRDTLLYHHKRRSNDTLYNEIYCTLLSNVKCFISASYEHKQNRH